MTVTEPTTETTVDPAGDTPADASVTVVTPAEADVVVDDVLVEEISIDGMCGVY